jgi:serine/threonine-protein kinase
MRGGSIMRDTEAADNPTLGDDVTRVEDRTLPAESDGTRIEGELPRAGGSPHKPAIPGYEILLELGRGGMGVVYLARQMRLDRPCALKMILAGAHADGDSIARFLAEAETVARLRHPHIVQVYSLGDHEGRPYLELEYLEDGSLANRLDGTPWLPTRAAQLVDTLARAVEEAHRLGIVHRDLKPGNILLAPDGTPKVTDFGLAKSLGSGSSLTQSGAVIGSPSYMAPEQAKGEAKQVGPPADVYALGATRGPSNDSTNWPHTGPTTSIVGGSNGITCTPWEIRSSSFCARGRVR